MHRAIDALGTADLEDAYVAAFEEWAASYDAGLWEATVADGLTRSDPGLRDLSRP